MFVTSCKPLDLLGIYRTVGVPVRQRLRTRVGFLRLRGRVCRLHITYTVLDKRVRPVVELDHSIIAFKGASRALAVKLLELTLSMIVHDIF